MSRITLPGRIAAEAIKNLFSTPATVGCGTNQTSTNPRHRGLISYDPTNCVACGLCMKDCPTGAIKVINDGTREEKKMRAELDTGRCIFCCQCVDSCNKKCITSTPEFSLNAGSREELKRKL